MYSFILILFLIKQIEFSSGCPTNVTCLEKETCCQTSSGLWSCCPIQDGICCDDGLHCCQKDQKCSPNGNCLTSNQFTISGFELKNPLSNVETVPCPDGSSCPDGNTCCQLSSGQYGCCPIPDAVCCSDHLHCCPNGYTCDVEHSRCKKKISETNDVPCPGGSSSCPDGETCCQLSSGQYGCCPLADAVCCSDHLHCCPHGYTCDVEKGQCIKGIFIPWFKKKPSIPRKQIETIEEKQTNFIEIETSMKSKTQILCPDATTSCPSSSTCCLSKYSTWGCCPVQHAVCCSDGEHCCPNHYSCNLHEVKCDHSFLESVDLIRKVPPTSKLSSKIFESNSISTIECPDEKSFCPEETTCCQLENGSYGCCPYSDGTCCADKIHCCGNGYSCDRSGERCIRHFDSFNITKIVQSNIKLKPLKKIEKFNQLNQLKYSSSNQTCPDQKTICSSKETCCLNKMNNQITYSCCPYTKGVCCGSNGSVCCPNNYICNEEQLSCQLSEKRMLKVAPLESDYNQCGSSDVACSNDQTCCKTHGSPYGEFACCDFKQGQCCEDGLHCCPYGTICDIKSGGCIKDY